MNPHHEMNSADGLPLSLGRGTGMTIKEFNRKLDAFMRKKKMPKLTLGGGPARSAQTPKAAPKFFAKVFDAWGML